jgi:hypothetical protein
MEIAGNEKDTSPLQSLVVELERGIGIIRDIDDATFARTEDGNGSVGAHFRHNLDFVNALLNGICERNIDYGDRARDPLVETQREYAEERILSAVRQLQNLKTEKLQQIVMVRSEINPDVWHPSSVAREVEFVHSHTIHHYALIARLIAAAGEGVGMDFGVAPSTLRFRTYSQSIFAG